MKVVIASDSYKESLSALDVGRAIADGVREIFPDAVCEVLPVADGGEGTVEALVDATGGSYETRTVTGPLGQPLDACFGRLGDGRTAVIEMAAASGLMHVAPTARDPMATTTRGTGELIRAALDLGQRHLILGIGGSATVDGGIGMLQALGVRLLDHAGRPVGEGGQALSRLASIDASGLDPRLAECVVEVACDVDNPLTGPHGAAAVFGPQKGATPAMVADLDRWLGAFAGIVARDLGVAVADVPGAGAAGGMGAAALAFFRARLRPGVEIVLDALDFAARLKGADLVITGEGRIDSQTVHGKTPIGVTRIARAHGIPVIGIAGSLSDDAEMVTGHGIEAVFSVLRRPVTLEEALAGAAGNVRRAARNVAAVLALGRRLGNGRSA